MKVTYNWLKDFVDIRVAADVLVDKLTMAGLTVEGLEKHSGDFIFEIEVTSNRPDWLSVIGVAREVAAVTGKKLKFSKSSFPRKLKSAVSKGLTLEIESKFDCPLYIASVITGNSVQASPDWLKKKLELVGCRSINNIVDVTNFLLFEEGQPMHAFDLEKLRGGKIEVRRARQNEKLVTIDGVERLLNSEDLVIADAEKAVALAGVMGGKDTEVSSGTKNILLETAVFNPMLIRRTRQRLGIGSEAAYRFERSVDRYNSKAVALRAVKFIEELSGGVCVLEKSFGESAPKKRTVTLSCGHLEGFLGTGIAQDKIKNILVSLGFKVGKNSRDGFLVEIPTYRQDVLKEIDLIEEVARIYGFEKIPSTLAAIQPQVSIYTIRDFTSELKNILIGLGLNEVVTYSLVDKRLLEGLGVPSSGQLEILNPLSQEQGVLRPSLIPGLLKCLAHNLNQQQEYVKIFEAAKGYFDSGKPEPQEELRLAVALCGVQSWLLPQGLIKDELGMLHLKGMLEEVFSRFGIKDYGFSSDLSEGKIKIMIKGENIGLIYNPQKKALDFVEIKNKQVAVLELSLEKLFAQICREKKFVALEKYPAISRDVSFVIKEEVLAEEVLNAIRSRNIVLLKELKISDSYKGKQIAPGFKALTISCLYRSPERTLTEEEISPAQAIVCAVLSERFAAKIR